MKSNWEYDTYAEQELAKFLDFSFYDKLVKNYPDKIEYKRFNDFKSQHEGFDVLLSVGSRKFWIDEKASLHYVNKRLPTFAFEINSIQKERDSPSEGWLFNYRKKINDYYLLIWPNTKNPKLSKTDLSSITQDDFFETDIMLISRKAIIDYLEQADWSKERIENKANEIRNADWTGNSVKTKFLVFEKKGRKGESIRVALDNVKEFWFFYTGTLAERPINIVIKKSELKKLALGTWVIPLDETNIKKLSKEYLAQLEEEVIQNVARILETDYRFAKNAYYNSRLRLGLEKGEYTLKFMSSKYLAYYLIDNEPYLFKR